MKKTIAVLLSAVLAAAAAGSVTLHPNPPFYTFSRAESFINGGVKTMEFSMQIGYPTSEIAFLLFIFIFVYCAVICCRTIRCLGSLN